MGSQADDVPAAQGDDDEGALSAHQLGQVYDELRALARRYLSRQRPDHTLQPTALVHEAYLRLITHRRSQGMDRTQFFWAAARAMRSVLVDHARRRRALKRGGTSRRVPLDQAVTSYDDRSIDLVALDEILERLKATDPRMTRIIDLRFFGGLSEEATAQALGVSARTVRREWRIARAWLHSQLHKEEPHDT
ncbi:MAG: ECF-type sigma factor [Planctomycetota bacterium]